MTQSAWPEPVDDPWTLAFEPPEPLRPWSPEDEQLGGAPVYEQSQEAAQGRQEFLGSDTPAPEMPTIETPPDTFGHAAWNQFQRNLASGYATVANMSGVPGIVKGFRGEKPTDLTGEDVAQVLDPSSMQPGGAFSADQREREERMSLAKQLGVGLVSGAPISALGPAGEVADSMAGVEETRRAGGGELAQAATGAMAALPVLGGKLASKLVHWAGNASPVAAKWVSMLGRLESDGLLDSKAMTTVERQMRAANVPDAEREHILDAAADHLFELNAPQSGTRPAVGAGILAEPLGKASSGSTPGGFYKGSDGVERYVKFQDPTRNLNEHANNMAYRDFGRLAPDSQVVDVLASDVTQGFDTAVASKRLGPEWVSLVDNPTKFTPAVARDYIRGVPVDIVLGNLDVAGNPGNLMSDGTRAFHIDTGLAGPNSHPFLAMNPKSTSDQWDEFVRSVHAAGVSPTGPTAPAPKPGSAEPAVDVPGDLVSRVLKPESLKAVKADLEHGIAGIEAGLAAKGGIRPYVAERWGHLDERDQEALAQQMTMRLEFVKQNVAAIAALSVLGMHQLFSAKGDSQ